MKIFVLGVVATLMLLIFFPTQDDLNRDYSFYYQNSKVKQVSNIINEFDLSDGKANPNLTNKVWNEEKKEYEDVPVPNLPKTDYPEPTSAYMPLIDPEMVVWSISAPPGYGTVSEYSGEYGYGYEKHTGWDMPAFTSKSTPYVYAAKAGIVLETDNQSLNVYEYPEPKPNPWGTTVLIGHADGTVTQYAHMVYNSLQVKTGDEVKAGAILGQLGNTGNSTGAHLHFETRSAAPGVKLPTLSKDTISAWKAGTAYGYGPFRSCTYIQSLKTPKGSHKPTEMMETEVPGEVWKVWKEREANS